MIPKPFEFSVKTYRCGLCSQVPLDVVKTIDDSHFNHPPCGAKKISIWLKEFYKLTISRGAIDHHWDMLRSGVDYSDHTKASPDSSRGSAEENVRKLGKAVSKRKASNRRVSKSRRASG